MTRRFTRAELARVRGISSYRLSTLRTRLKLTTAELALLLGVDQRTVYRWEAGSSSPTGPSLTVLLVIEQHATVASARSLVQSGGLRELVYRALTKREKHGRRKRSEEARAPRQLRKVGQPDEGTGTDGAVETQSEA